MTTFPADPDGYGLEAPAIPDEAVEAALDALNDAPWVHYPPNAGDEPGEEAIRAALVAALPHLQAHFDTRCNVQQEAAEAQRDNALARERELEEMLQRLLDGHVDEVNTRAAITALIRGKDVRQS